MIAERLSRADIERYEWEGELGERSRDIALSGAFPEDRSPGRRPFDRSGDFVSSTGAVLSVFSNITGEDVPSTGPHELTIIIQDAGEDEELRSAMRPMSQDLFGVDAIAINIYDRSPNFGSYAAVYAPKVKGAWRRTTYGGHTSAAVRLALPEILLNRLENSEPFKLALKQQARTQE